MIPTSRLFQESMRFSRTMSTEMDIVFDGTIVASRVNISEGTVVTDRGSNTRYSAGVSLAQYPWEQLPLNVEGTRVRLRRGVESIGTREEVQVGEYLVHEYGRSARGALTVTLKGLETLVIEDRFIRPRKPPYGASTVDTITALIKESVPDAVVVARCSFDRKVTATGAWERERWDAITALANSIIAEVYCGHDGRWYIVDQPDLTKLVPVFQATAGPTGVLVDQSRTITREGVYNAWSVSGQSSDPEVPAVWGFAADLNPNSRTRYGGPFGKNVGFYSSQFFNSDAQCLAYAQKKLADSLALGWKMSLVAGPLPMLEAGDAVGTSTETGEAAGVYLLQKTSLPLGTGTWSADVLSDGTVQPDEEEAA